MTQTKDGKNETLVYNFSAFSSFSLCLFFAHRCAFFCCQFFFGNLMMYKRRNLRDYILPIFSRLSVFLLHFCITLLLDGETESARWVVSVISFASTFSLSTEQKVITVCKFFSSCFNFTSFLFFSGKFTFVTFHFALSVHRFPSVQNVKLSVTFVFGSLLFHFIRMRMRTIFPVCRRTAKSHQWKLSAIVSVCVCTTLDFHSTNFVWKNAQENGRRVRNVRLTKRKRKLAH